MVGVVLATNPAKLRYAVSNESSFDAKNSSNKYQKLQVD